MSPQPPRTAKEAIALQFMSDVDRVLDRFDELRPVMEAATSTLETLEAFRTGLEAITDHAKASAVQYIIESTNATAGLRRAELAAELEKVALEAWGGAVSQRVDQVTARMARALEQANSSKRWAPLVVTALVSCALGVAIGGALAAGLLHHV